jgi:hypothetical protein
VVPINVFSWHQERMLEARLVGSWAPTLILIGLPIECAGTHWH